MINNHDNFMINNEVDEVIEGFFMSLLNRYQNNFEKLIKGSEFVFDYVCSFIVL